MRKFALVLLTAGIASLSVPVQAASDSLTPSVKIDLRKSIKKNLGTRRVGNARPINGSATVTEVWKADVVTVNFGIVGKGQDAGGAVMALSQQKDILVNSAKDLGYEIISATTTSLNVRSRPVRGYASDGSRTTNNVFNGTLSVLLTFKATDNVLIDVGKIADGKVSSIGRMMFSFSPEKWETKIADLKKQALAQARTNASEQARLQGREITTVARSNFRPPRRMRRNQQQLVEVRITTSVSFNTQ